MSTAGDAPAAMGTRGAIGTEETEWRGKFFASVFVVPLFPKCFFSRDCGSVAESRTESRHPYCPAEKYRVVSASGTIT